MTVTVVTSKQQKEVIVRPVEEEDFRQLTKKRYSFPWKEWKGEPGLYKLSLIDDEDILGVMALEDKPHDKRIEIKLLASSIENVGKKKLYDGIAGTLIAYACREAVKKYGALACVSLVPKTKLKSSYVEKYGMMDAGKQLFLEAKPLIEIILKYLP